MTLRYRISVAAAAGVLIVVSAVSIVLYLSYDASLRSRVDPTLVDAAQQANTVAQRIKQSAGSTGATPDVSAPVTIGSVDIQLFPGPVSAGQPTRFGPLSSHDAAVADDAALRTAALLLVALTAAATAVTYAAARLTAGRILRPIGDLTAAAEHVTQTRDLSARLRNGGADEVGRLSAAFDTMLGALSESVTAQRQLVADASHELRTPLTSLTTNLDLLEEGAGLADPQAPALVRAAREQAGELDLLVTDLLDLARYRESAAHRETVRLDLLADEVVRRLIQRAPGTVIETQLQPSLVEVDPAAVDRAITNLIDNAIKWNPPDAAVRVVVENGRVSVTDHGPGIAQGDLPHVFERFYRAPAARGMPGAGLGLAIVGSVAEANGGTLDVQTGPGGSTFTLGFAPSAQGDPS